MILFIYIFNNTKEILKIKKKCLPTFFTNFLFDLIFLKNKVKEEKMKKRLVVTILTVAIILSAFTVWSMVRKSQADSFKTYASGIECNAQGDFMPEPFEETFVTPSTQNENDILCSMQGDIMPKGWDEEEEEED